MNVLAMPQHLPLHSKASAARALLPQRLAQALSLLLCGLLASPAAQAGGPRFVAAGAEVTDTATGLIWARCSDGQTWDGSRCAGTATSFTWADALARARSAAAADGLPWRLPNVKELATLVDDDRINPAINTEFFPNTSRNGYWSSTYTTNGSFQAWYVRFDEGTMFSGAVMRPFGAVRLVRSGS